MLQFANAFAILSYVVSSVRVLADPGLATEVLSQKGQDEWSLLPEGGFSFAANNNDVTSSSFSSRKCRVGCVAFFRKFLHVSYIIAVQIS
jgi:hypothetical protein